jgi:uncharacterized OsmC-like protein
VRAPSSLELFLSGVVSCAVLMLERIARADGRTLGPLRAEMEASRDPESPGQPPVLDSARLTFVFSGMSREEAGQLVETFKGRWPLYGSVAVATPDTQVDFRIEN